MTELSLWLYTVSINSSATKPIYMYMNNISIQRFNQCEWSLLKYHGYMYILHIERWFEHRFDQIIVYPYVFQYLDDKT